jgi:hypothetical protein
MSPNLRIGHVGNWCIHIGQKYVESPFEAPSKDVEVLNYVQPFVTGPQCRHSGHLLEAWRQSPLGYQFHEVEVLRTILGAGFRASAFVTEARCPTHFSLSFVR